MINSRQQRWGVFCASNHGKKKSKFKYIHLNFFTLCTSLNELASVKRMMGKFIIQVNILRQEHGVFFLNQKSQL